MSTSSINQNHKRGFGQFFENLPSHIKDTTDYLKKMENLTIAENTTLVTMDVTSLYTNIPHDDGIQCTK
jgi:hypothetical protein